MKQVIFFISALALLSCGSLRRSSKAQGVAIKRVPFAARGTYGPRKRILVLPFLDEKVDRPQKVIRGARATVVRSLARTNAFVIVRNDELPQDAGKFITENREYDLDKIAPLAASLGVAAVVEGKIMEVKAKRIGDQVGLFRQVKARVETTIRIRVVSAKNGRIILQDVRKGEIETSTTRVAQYSFSDRYLEEDPKLIRLSVARAFSGSIVNIVKAVDKISWEGRVALVNGERVFINAGRLSGIQVGDILKITEEGKEIFDPETGGLLGRAPGRMKGTVEVVSYFGKDGAICLLHSGSGFSENDRVELY